MWLALLYFPCLILSPFLLVAAIMLFVPGGLIIVFGGVSYLALLLGGMVGSAAHRTWRRTRTNRMRLKAAPGTSNERSVDGEVSAANTVA